MSKLVYRVAATLAALLLVTAACLSVGCTSQKGEGFAIYLTREDIPPDQMASLGRFEIAEQPVISVADVITYNAQTHELKLTPGAYERICQLEVPVRGRSFAVCVDRDPVYWGAFWTPVSSISFDGVTIWKPFSPGEPYVVTLELGYPAPSFYQGKDPRNDASVLDSLDRAGKLVARLSITDVENLPGGMKGYELYSWSQDGQWHFTLITGTNRNKTLEEILSDEDIVSEAGWVQVHVEGVDAIQAALGKLRPGEEVFWLARPRTEATPTAGVTFALPPASMVDSIKSFCSERGLKLTVMPTS